jgi:lysophospholipase L1-like esterase
MTDFAVTFVDPNRLENQGEQEAFPLGIDRRVLAQGDSWFSIGAFPPGLTGNILEDMVLSRSVAIVNCARPGKELRLMVDTMRDPHFMRFLSGGNLAVEFDAIFVSAGGNDLIAAAQTPPGAASGPEQQILLTPAQRGGVKVPVDQYVSADGWKAFSDHMAYWFGQLVQARDSAINRRKPLFFHNYASCMPRPAGAGLGFGPWLSAAMTDYAVPADDWRDLAKALLDRLGQLLDTIVAGAKTQDPNCNIYLIDTKGQAKLVLADPGSTADSGDWINEIHPNYQGYAKIDAVWRTAVDARI